MRVLLAEDDPVIAMLLEKELRRTGHFVHLARNGKEAWAILEKVDVRVVLTDWMMPEMDGIELCRRIRQHPERSYAYIIMLTALAGQEHQDEAVRVGVDDFLMKPYDRSHLHARLATAKRVLEMQERLETQNARLSETNQQLTEATEIAEYARNRSIQLFEDLPVAGFTYDTEGRIFEWNRRAEHTFDIPGHIALGRIIWEVLGEDLIGPEGRHEIEEVFQGQAFEDQPWENGELFLLVSSSPFRNRDGKITGALTTAVDVTRLRQAEKKIEQQKQDLMELNSRLRALAVTDGLTGIPNHRAFQERLHDVVMRAADGGTFSLAMLDIDFFKRFNDTHGHQAGDEVLRKTAECLASNLRGSDFIARYGGEEFAIIFENVDEERAAWLCDRLRVSVSEIENPYAQITASLGVATYGEAATDPERLIEQADRALYAAKHRGRNQVAAHSTLSPFEGTSGTEKMAA